MPLVKMPDGAVVDMPDTLTPELATRLRAMQGGAPAEKKEPDPPQSMAGFVGGNINKGLANRLGAPVDIARNAIDDLSTWQGAVSTIPGMKIPMMLGEKFVPGMARKPTPQRPPDVGGSQWFEQKAQQAGLIPPSAEPRGTGQQLAATAIQNADIVVPGSIAAGRAVPGAARRISNAVADVTGSKVPGAMNEAGQAARTGAESGAARLGETAARREQQVSQLDKVRQDLTQRLDATRTKPASLADQGKTIRDVYTKTIDAAKTERSKTADQLFEEVRQLAVAKEARGARVDTTAITKALDAMLAKSDGIPDLQAKLKQMKSSITGAPKEVDAPQVWVPDGVKRPEPPPKGKTFDQLELTRRYLNDIAYASEMEGYSAIVRGEAKTAARAVDQAMVGFLPEFGAYKDTYRKMSEALETANTRFGKAIAGTEGGLKGDKYSKVADQAIPGKLFASRDGVDLMVDALAGGKNAPAAARVQAQKVVDEMVENWIVEGVRSSGKTGAQGLKEIRAPQMRSTLEGAPAVGPKLTRQFSGEAKLEGNIERVGKKATELDKQGSKARDVMDTIKTDLAMADEKAALPGEKARREAYDAYVTALTKARRADRLEPEQYKAAIRLIDRADTLEEKTRIARRLLGRIAIAGAVVGGGAEAARYIK